MYNIGLNRKYWEAGCRGSMFIYLDESGDLGFDFNKSKTTKKFVITLLVCDGRNASKAFKKAIDRTLRNKINRKKKKAARKNELKGTNTSIENKKYFYRHLKNNEWGIYTVILNKARVESHLRTKRGKKKLYNFIARFLIEKLPLRDINTNVRLIVDRSKNKEGIRDFNQYLQDQIESLLPLNTQLKIEHLTSQENKSLQAVDLFCWGIARKYEHNDTEWYDIIKDKIVYETEYLRA